MKARLQLFGLGLALLLGQALVAAILPQGIRPDLVLVFVLAIGLRTAGIGPLTLAFFFGFIVDVQSTSPLGLYALLRGTACASTRLMDRALYLRAAMPWTLYVLAYAVVDNLLLGGLLRLLRPEEALAWQTILLRIPGNAILTALVAVPLLGLMRRLGTDPEAESNWASFGPPARL